MYSGDFLIPVGQPQKTSAVGTGIKIIQADGLLTIKTDTGRTFKAHAGDCFYDMVPFNNLTISSDANHADNVIFDIAEKGEKFAGTGEISIAAVIPDPLPVIVSPNPLPVVVSPNPLPVTLPAPSAGYYVGIDDSVLDAAGATDVLTIQPSTTKSVRLNKIHLLIFSAGAGAAKAILYKRSTLDTGGTASLQTKTPMDPTDPAATAIVKFYTANPTALGTKVNIVEEFFQTVAGQGWSEIVWDWTGLPETKRPACKVNTTENFALNADGLANNQDFAIILDYEEF